MDAVKNYKEYIKNIIKYLLFFLSFFILAKASVYGMFFPFAFGLYFALVWCNQKISILSLLYIFAMLVSSSVEALPQAAISACFTIFFVMLVSLIHTRLKKRIKLSLLFVYAFFSQIGYIFSQIYFENTMLIPFLTILVGLLFMFACIKIFEVVLLRGFVYKLNAIEVISALVVLCALSAGLSTFTIFEFEILKLFACVVILLSAYIFNITTCLLVASVIGLAPIMSAGDITYLAPFAIWALTVSAFRLKNRILPSLALIAVDAILGFFVNVYYSYSIISLLPIVVGTLFFIALPNAWMDKITEFFKVSDSNLAMRSVVNRSRDSLCRRLYDLSQVFGEMDYVFRSMIKGGISKEDAKIMLLNEVTDKVCSDCPERNFCHRKSALNTQTAFKNLISVALERGKSTLLDVPPYLTSRCSRVSNLVGQINQLSLQYSKYSGVINNLDASRVLIAEQLSGVSGIMKDLASEVKRNISFDVARENQIINELSYNNIVCGEAVIYEQSVDAMSATLVIRREDTVTKKIEEIVSKICKNKMIIESVEPSKKAGWKVISMQTAPKYDVIYGTAGCAKDGMKISGDCYSIIRVDNDKFLLALCDGMGSGEKAEKTSSLALGLVENFYKAGFDNEIILSSVNKLLSLNRDEMFSALDMCVVNTRVGTADFIKMGAPNSYIKRNETVSQISGGALPLGIIHDMQPIIVKEVLASGDLLYLYTDGISDSFETEEELADFINNQTALNPQTLAENLLAEAIARSNGARDDMTVIIAKIFEV